MAWNSERARKRIEGFKDNTPQGRIIVEDLQRYFEKRRGGFETFAATESVTAAVVQIPRNQAITTDGVHVYANLTSYNAQLTDGVRETEASHRRALQFLHAHYGACDRLIDRFGMQRVDFHGSRLHAVVLEPVGPAGEAQRIATAMGFAAAFREMVERTRERYGEAYATGVRIGIDSGAAVAIDNGKRDEAEPLFIGSPANHAAKLAYGDEPGINPSDRVRRFLNTPSKREGVALETLFERQYLNESVFDGRGFERSDRRLELAFESFGAAMDERLRDSQDRGNRDAVFSFHYKEPPLRDIVFADHPPSNAIRMPLASVFADIDGFTAYIDNAIQTGQVAEAVANLHVLRAEMAAVVREDFGGRKVRFIGDCIHALVAKGSARETDEKTTILEAVQTAAGLRSSFELCRSMLPGVADLGLAIAIDFGETPICRIGLRGEHSVRCATSRACCVSEAAQQGCSGEQTALGETAYEKAPARVQQLFGSARTLTNLTIETASALLTGVSMTSAMAAAIEPSHAHLPPIRAHSD